MFSFAIKLQDVLGDILEKNCTDKEENENKIQKTKQSINKHNNSEDCY